MSNNTFYISSIRNQYEGEEALILSYSFNDEEVQSVPHHSVNFIEGDGVLIPATDQSTGLEVPGADHFLSVKCKFGELGLATYHFWAFEDAVFGVQVDVDGSIIQDTIREIEHVHSSSVRSYRAVVSVENGKAKLELVRPYRVVGITNKLSYPVQVRYTLGGEAGPQGTIDRIEKNGGYASFPGAGIGLPILAESKGDLFMEENDRMWFVVENNWDADNLLNRRVSLWQSANFLEGAYRNLNEEEEHGYTVGNLRGEPDFVTLTLKETDADGIVIFGEQTVEP